MLINTAYMAASVVTDALNDSSASARSLPFNPLVRSSLYTENAKIVMITPNNNKTRYLEEIRSSFCFLKALLYAKERKRPTTTAS